MHISEYDIVQIVRSPDGPRIKIEVIVSGDMMCNLLLHASLQICFHCRALALVVLTKPLHHYQLTHTPEQVHACMEPWAVMSMNLVDTTYIILYSYSYPLFVEGFNCSLLYLPGTHQGDL